MTGYIRGLDLSISAVVATFDRPQLLRHVVRALESQLKSSDELIVVNDGGARPDLPPWVRYFSQPRMGFRVATARNRGIANAVNPFVLMLGDETVLRSGCLEAFRKHMKCGLMLLGGLDKQFDLSTIPPDDQLKTWQSRHTHPNITKGILDDYAGGYGSNLLFHREDAIEAGGFDERFNGCWGYEDSCFVRAMLLKGVELKVLLEAGATHHWHPKTFESRECIRKNRALAKILVGQYDSGEFPEFDRTKYID